ncbi:hypothetical protein SEA_STEPMIH_86 [Mycobacterium phage StepMih]|uniref:Uncharacterized protein n=1 Tax=Mycobacterium phage StepMih TaxID=2015850 RepID=A0A286MQW7_9CAUD|nr:hypothetical protein SEA_STEPMIH_86 [Mycobacterium phage StepMih]
MAMKVFVYKNLHATKKAGHTVYSIKALSGAKKGKVIARSRNVMIGLAEGKVSEAGRQRVLRERKKSVHAGIVGHLMGTHPVDPETLGGTTSRITYNPYKYEQFVHADTEAPFEGAPVVCLSDEGVIAVN